MTYFMICNTVFAVIAISPVEHSFYLALVHDILIATFKLILY